LTNDPIYFIGKEDDENLIFAIVAVVLGSGHRDCFGRDIA
jgi:hypothetical protein